jgi:hypothetical protein
LKQIEGDDVQLNAFFAPAFTFAHRLFAALEIFALAAADFVAHV